MGAHIEANPCLTMEWQELWPILKAHGWRQVWGRAPSAVDGARSGSGAADLEGAGAVLSAAFLESLPQYYEAPVGGRDADASTPLTAGIHVFTSQDAVMKFIARYE